MRDYISYANDDLDGLWNSKLEWAVDPRDGKFKWLLIALRSIHTGDEITWSYRWEYWSHHSVGEVQLFAWRRNVKLGNTGADNVNPYHLFDWVVDRNLNFIFNQEIAFEDYDASSVVPSTSQP